MSPKNRPEIEIELSDQELRKVSGAMTCETALALAKGYEAIGVVLQSFGDYTGASNNFGLSEGVAQGACTP